MQVQQQSQAYKLVSQPEEFKDLRSDSRSFLNKLATEKQFLFDMLDICVRPGYFQTTRKLTLTPAYPAAVIESFAALYEDFINLLAYGKIYEKEINFSDPEPEEEEDLSKPQEENNQFDFLLYLHRAFEQPETEETAVSNLSRILGPLYYHSPGQMTRFYQLHKRQKELFFRNLWRRGVMEIFCKLMEAEEGKIFFKAHKSHYIDSYYTLFSKNLTGQNQLEWLESCLLLHKFIMEKMEERYDGNKYRVLLEILNTNDMKLLDAIIGVFFSLSERGALLAIKLAQQCIKNDSWIWGAIDLKVPMTHLNRKNSMAGTFYSEQEQLIKKTHHLPHRNLKQLSQVLTMAKQKYILRKAPLHLISFFRTLYFWTKVVSLQCENGPQLKKQLQNFINYDLLQQIYEVIKNHPNSSSLHNYIKQFLIQCLHHKLIPISYFLQPSSPYILALSQWLPRKGKRAAVPFGPQSYHLFNEIVSSTEDVSVDVCELISQQKARKEKAIGGHDPRKLSDNLNPISPGFSESSEEIIEIDIASFGSSLSQQDGASPNPAKLAHMTSIEKNNNFLEEEQYEMKQK